MSGGRIATAGESGITGTLRSLEQMGVISAEEVRSTPSTPFPYVLPPLARPPAAAGFLPRVEVEIHTQKLLNAPVTNHINSVRQSILRMLRPGQTVRLVLWDKFEDRIALAGGFARTSRGREHAPAWGVHMGHIARRPDAPRGCRTSGSS